VGFHPLVQTANILETAVLSRKWFGTAVKLHRYWFRIMWEQISDGKNFYNY